MSEIRVTNILGENGNSPVNFTQGINMSGIVTATSFVPTVGQLSHRNLVINGAMIVSQRGTSFSGTAQQYTLDRMQMNTAGNDEIAQTEQAAVTSGGAYTSGFRKCMKIINGNQTSGAGAGDIVHLKMVLEAQDIANSGWNYTSSSSFITLSFWIKSSVAQNFPITLRSEDGTRQVYNMTTGSLTADTWTKVTKTIPGNSNLQFDDNVNAGLTLFVNAFVGTDYTTGGLAQNAWSAWSGAKQGDNMTSTWYTTNDATLEITGLQLEVGPVATPFEHRTFADEITCCSRYLQIFHVPTSNSKRASNITATVHGAGNGVYLNVAFIHPMRVAPSVTVDGAFGGNIFTGSWSGDTLSSITAEYETDALSTLGFNGITSASISGSGRTVGLTGQIYTANNGSNDAALIYSAEL